MCVYMWVWYTEVPLVWPPSGLRNCGLEKWDTTTLKVSVSGPAVDVISIMYNFTG